MKKQRKRKEKFYDTNSKRIKILYVDEEQQECYAEWKERKRLENERCKDKRED